METAKDPIPYDFKTKWRSLDMTSIAKLIFEQGSLFVAVILIVLSLAYNIYAAYNLDFLMKYGSRENSECGNEYMEIETANYQIYNVIASPNTTYSSYMYNAFKFIQGAYITIFIAITINILIDFGIIINNRGTLGLTISDSKKTIIWGILTLVIMISSIISYLVKVYAPYITPMFQDFKTADIIIKKPDIKKQLELYLTPISFLILPPLLFIGYIATYNQSKFSFKFDKEYFTFIAFYVIIIIISIKFNTSSLGVIGSIHNVYEPATETIKSKLNTILGANPTTYPAMPPSTSSDQLKAFLIKNIKSIEKVDGDNFILQDYNDKFWKYLIHQNGKELEDIYKSAPDTDTRNAITTIRSNMRTLRNDTTISGSLTGFTNITIQFAVIVFSLIVFAIFHLMYKHYQQPVTASIFIGSFALFLLILGPIYGWIMRVVSKNY
jgi:hypothetical protein